MKKIELYATWFDHHGNPYPPGVYVADALPKRALEIEETLGRVFDPDKKEESLEKDNNVEVKTKSNSTIKEVEHKTTKRQPKSKTARKKPETQDLTPKENHSTKIESKQPKASE